MSRSLDGWAALVTGGGSGIGLACAQALLADGATLTIAGRSRDRLDAAVQELGGSERVAVAVCDVADEEQVGAAVEAAAAPLGGLHICVAAAGTGGAAPIVVTDAGEWDRVLATNLTGAFFTLKHAAAAMARAGGGSFVGISSIAGTLTHRFMTAYCVSKAGLEMLIRNGADELGVAGVRVNGVRPGLVPTDLAAPLVASDEIRADYLAQMPVSRLGTVDDIAAAVRYLCGPESGWVTGQILSVDGGHTLRRGPDLESGIRLMYGDAAAEGRA